MNDDVGPRDERPDIGLGPDVAAHLLDAALELAVVERGNVERADAAAVGEHAAREMEPQEAGPAGDRDQRHAGRVVTRLQRARPARRAGHRRASRPAALR